MFKINTRAPAFQGQEIAMTQMTVYEVLADRVTGEWIREPKATEEIADRMDFLNQPDTGSAHHDTYESPFDGSTRLLRVVWQD